MMTKQVEQAEQKQRLIALRAVLKTLLPLSTDQRINVLLKAVEQLRLEEEEKA